MFPFAGQMAAERALASYTQTYRVAHMVSETDRGTPSRLLRGNGGLCQGLRAQGLCCGVNNTNREMEEKPLEGRNNEKQYGKK